MHFGYKTRSLILFISSHFNAESHARISARDPVDILLLVASDTKEWTQPYKAGVAGRDDTLESGKSVEAHHTAPLILQMLFYDVLLRSRDPPQGRLV